MASKSSEQQYLETLCLGLPHNHDIWQVLTNNYHPSPRVTPRVLYVRDEKRVNHLSTPSDVIAAAQQDTKDERSIAFIIEDINGEWIAALGSTWDIDPPFFSTHVENTEGYSSLWEAVTKSRHHRKVASRDPMKTVAGWDYIDGILPHLVNRRPLSLAKRRTGHDKSYGNQVNTRISYYRVSKRFCKQNRRRRIKEFSLADNAANKITDLFLVDKPVKMEPLTTMTSRLSAWMPYSRNRGGLPIPQLYEMAEFSAFDMLASFSVHRWHFYLLEVTAHREPNGIIQPTSLSYLLAASLWKTNLHYLDSEIKRIAFQDLRRPSVTINDQLHNLRHDLDTLRKEVRLAKDWYAMPWDDRTHFEDPGTNPENVFEEILKESQALEAFLMDTFQLLMSTISVLDSQASILDARRGSRLTQLATIYVPPSFVTGVWGMNVKEINGSPLSIWTAAVGLVVVGLLTALTLWIMSSLPDPTAPVKDRRQTQSKTPFWRKVKTEGRESVEP